MINNFAKQTKTLNLLGLAQKAGKLATGFDAVKYLLSKNQAKLILLVAM